MLRLTDMRKNRTSSHVKRKLDENRFQSALSRKQKRQRKRSRTTEAVKERAKRRLKLLVEKFGGDFTYQQILLEWLPVNLRYLVTCAKTDLCLSALSEAYGAPNRHQQPSKVLYVPETFSLVRSPEVAFEFFGLAIRELLFGHRKRLYFSYKRCRNLDIGAQVILDIIKKESLVFISSCLRFKQVRTIGLFAKEVGITDVHETDVSVRKILSSVGSLAVQLNLDLKFPDIVPYRLCEYNRRQHKSESVASYRKEIDTTQLVEYVIESLSRMNRTLTTEQKYSLSLIIGEILINAEEHSTTGHRFSIGYFQNDSIENERYGVFRLVILNFGKTIYETFADNEFANPSVLNAMSRLSDQYTSNHWFFGKQFEEENLWTLYALQEGVTSIPDKKRGNGSIQFIENFFSLKGGEEPYDVDESRMTILSGHTRVIFDGRYSITTKERDGEMFKVMTFNDTGNLEKPPDKRYVKYEEKYFPGTIISAKIVLFKANGSG